MSTPVNWNGTVYNIVAPGETGYGTTMSNFFIDVASNAVTLSTGQTISNKTFVNSTISGILNLPAGTVAAPSLTFVGDANTGFYSPGADSIGFATGGTESLRLTTVASAVNNLNIAASATGTGPTLSVIGSDTNVDLNLNSKGTGNIVLNSGLVLRNTTTAARPTNVSGNLFFNTTLNQLEVYTSSWNAIPFSNGQVWTGNNDFTGSNITVSTQLISDNSTKAASTAFVNAMAFSAALPAQTGNAGKYITTDGTTASWVPINNLYQYQNFGGF